MGKPSINHNRLKQRLQEAKKAKEKLFCAYITLGYPNLPFTKSLIKRMESVGVDMVELGFPFSDPLADGPVIQHASEYALHKKVQMKDAFRIARELRQSGSKIPLIFFSYYNPIFHFGTQAFANQASRAGFDALISPDLPPDEDSSLPKALQEKGLSLIYLASPTTDAYRMRLIANRSQGFIYYVSLKGVTGVRSSLSVDLRPQVQRIKRATQKPVLIGFGVSTADQAFKASRASDGVIVGSAIVKSIRSTGANLDRVTRFVETLVKKTKQAGR